MLKNILEKVIPEKIGRSHILNINIKLGTESFFLFNKILLIILIKSIKEIKIFINLGSIKKSKLIFKILPIYLPVKQAGINKINIA